MKGRDAEESRGVPWILLLRQERKTCKQEKRENRAETAKSRVSHQPAKLRTRVEIKRSLVGVAALRPAPRPPRSTSCLRAHPFEDLFARKPAPPAAEDALVLLHSNKSLRVEIKMEL